MTSYFPSEDRSGQAEPIRTYVGVDGDGLASGGPAVFKEPFSYADQQAAYRKALDKRVEEDPDLVALKGSIEALQANALAGWAAAQRARTAAAIGWLAFLLMTLAVAVILVWAHFGDKL